MMGRLLLSFLVVAAVVGLLYIVAVRLVYQKTTVTLCQCTICVIYYR